MKEKLFENPVFKLSLEVVGIFFAVVVALAADQWVEDRERIERKELILESIHSEISTNSAELAEALEQLSVQLEKLEALNSRYSVDTTVSINDEVREVWRVSFTGLRSTSWQSLILQSDILILIDIGRVEHLSAIYSLQSDIKDYLTKMISEFGDKTTDLVQPKKGSGVLRSHYHDLSTLNQLAINLQSLLQEYLEAND